MNKTLSPKFFIFSMLIIIATSVAGIAGLYYLLNGRSSPAIMAPGPVTSKPVSLTLALNNPDDNILTFGPDLLIQGTTSPESTVLISTNSDDQIVQADAKGNFSSSIKVEEGVNQLNITAFDSLGNSKREDRTIYYSTNKL